MSLIKNRIELALLYGIPRDDFDTVLQKHKLFSLSLLWYKLAKAGVDPEEVSEHYYSVLRPYFKSDIIDEPSAFEAYMQKQEGGDNDQR